MDIIPAYAIAAGGILFFFLLHRLRAWIMGYVDFLSILASKHFTYPYFLRRHRLVGPWTRAVVALQIIFVSIVLFAICFATSIFPFSIKLATIVGFGDRSGTLALVILIPLIVGAHHTFFTDLLDVPLSTMRLVHRSVGIVMCVLCLLHALVAVASGGSLPLANPQNLFAVIAASSLAVLPLLSLPFFRQFSYEIFLRTHQALALLATYSLWRHLPSETYFPRAYMYIAVGSYIIVLVLRISTIILHNGVFRYRRARGTLTHDHGAVKIKIQLQKPLEIECGKYIHLWLPSVGFWAFLQCHPFMVLSWAPGPQHSIELLVDPKRGLTRELLYHAKTGHATNLLAMYGGPHGISVEMKDFESILMVASGFGIAAHLSYLKRLVYGYNARVIRARRIHLVWQIRHKADAVVAQLLLNDALQDDKLDDGCILSISIYLESNDIPVFPFGKRATIYPGPAPLHEIFMEEASGKYIKKPEVEGSHRNAMASAKPVSDGLDVELSSQRGTMRDGRMLVTVSGYAEFRDQLRELTREHLEQGVEMVELDYQPT